MISSYKELSLKDKQNIESIFFETSSVKNFKSQAHKDEFREKYFSYYQKVYPDLFFVYKENEALGYICGMEDTLKDETYLKLNTHYNEFLDCLKPYPSHLHINFSFKGRGLGLGKILVQHFITHLNSPGVHIITSKSARNVSFYDALGFNFRKEFGELLFMGKSLS